MKSVSGGSRERVITGISPNTQYYFKIRAVTGAGYSDYSQQIKARTATGGVAPPVVVAPTEFRGAVQGSNIKLTWRSLSGAPVTGNLLQRLMKNGYLLQKIEYRKNIAAIYLNSMQFLNLTKDILK